MKKLKLTKGLFAIVDDDDFEVVNQHKWHASVISGTNGKKFSARSRIHGRDESLHRFLMKVNDGVVDHINGDTLDNRRENLRICTASQNKMNRVVKSGKKMSRYKGVFKRGKSFWVQVAGKYYGNTVFEVVAARVYDFWAKRHFGEFAKLNFS